MPRGSADMGIGRHGDSEMKRHRDTGTRPSPRQSLMRRPGDTETQTQNPLRVPPSPLHRVSLYLAFPALIIALLAFSSCSKAKDAQKEGKDSKSATQQAAESIRNLGKKPIDKAREAQGLGEDRTKAIDEAVGGLNRK
jgi:hypothetical protein